MLIRRGASALSAFRRHKLTQRIALATDVSLSIQAEFHYFIALDQDLTPNELSVLDQLLQASPVTDAPADNLMVVIPRPGTISPWSSRATDIARRCGLRSLADRARHSLYLSRCCLGYGTKRCCSGLDTRPNDRIGIAGVSRCGCLICAA